MHTLLATRSRLLGLLLALGLLSLGCPEKTDPQPTPDAGPTQDAGPQPVDGGHTDAGQPDAGPPDAGPGPDGGATDAGPLDLQLNDVSILMPLAPGGTQLSSAYLGASSSGARGELLPRATYDAIGHLAGSSGNPPVGGVGETRWEDLRVVAIRIDPCFAALSPDPHGVGCQNQLRLIMQEVLEVQGNVYAYDSALHLFYSLTREELLDVAHALQTLRRANATSSSERLGKLAVHPIVARQGLQGAYADQVRQLVLAHAGKDNLFRVTEMSATQPGFAWQFYGFDVVPPTGKTEMKIPTLPNQETSQVFFRGFGVDMEGQFTPSTTSTDDMTMLSSVTAATQLDAQHRDHEVAALVHIEHPAKNSPDTIDCASCHLAMPTAKDVVLPKLGIDTQAHAETFHPDARDVLTSEMVSTMDETGGFNLHAFSYVGASPAINQRTVNESAAIVTYLNNLTR